MTLSSPLILAGMESPALTSHPILDSQRLGDAPAAPSPLLPWLEQVLGRRPADSGAKDSSGAARFDRLSSQETALLSQRFGANAVPKLENLSKEKDLDLLYSELYSWGLRLESQGRDAGAATLYQFLVRTGDKVEGPKGAATQKSGDEISSRAANRLAVMSGQGSFGDSAEWYGRKIAEGISDGAGLFAFGMAGISFRLGRLAVARFLLSSGPRALAGSGTALRIASGLGGFLVEGAVFPGAHRAAEYALGRSLNLSLSRWQDDLASSYLILGGLRAGGVVGRTASLWVGRNRGFLQALTGSMAFSRGATTTASLASQYGGVLLGQWGQERFHLADSRNLPQHLAAGLASLIQMQGMGALYHRWSRHSLGRFERALDLHTERLLLHRGPWSGQALAAATATTFAPSTRVEGSQVTPYSFSVRDGQGGDGRGPVRGESGVAREASEGARTGESHTAPPKMVDPLKGETAAAFLLESNPARFEQGLRNFINSQDLPIAVAEVTGNFREGLGRFLMVNDRFTERFGFTSETIQGHSLREIFQRQEAIAVLPRIIMSLAKGYFPPMVLKLRHADGNFVRVEGHGVYREVFGRNIAFGFFRDPLSEKAFRREPVPIVEMIRDSSKKQIKPDRSGVVELKSLVEMNMQIAMPNTMLIPQLRASDLVMRITGSTYEGILERQKAPWLRFLEMMDRKEPFPVGRRLRIEVPEGPGRRAETLVLIRGQDGFHELGRAPAPKDSGGE